MEQTAARDETLAQLLADLTEQARRGQSPDVDAVARQHPDIAKELRGLWAAVQLAEALAQRAPPTPTVDFSPSKAPGHDSSAGPAAGLPRTFGDYDLLEE